SHDAHHRHTNRMARTRDVDHDNAWLPLSIAQHARLRARHPAKAWLYRAARVVLPLGSTIHLVTNHFRPPWFKPAQRPQVRRSIVILAACGALIAGASLAATGSLFLVLHLWLLPALVFQCWMSLYTFLHHTAADKRVYEPAAWRPYAGQVEGTINCL